MQPFPKRVSQVNELIIVAIVETESQGKLHAQRHCAIVAYVRGSRRQEKSARDEDEDQVE
jgi:hypothetical protein